MHTTSHAILSYCESLEKNTVKENKPEVNRICSIGENETISKQIETQSRYISTKPAWNPVRGGSNLNGTEKWTPERKFPGGAHSQKLIDKLIPYWGYQISRD